MEVPLYSERPKLYKYNFGLNECSSGKRDYSKRKECTHAGANSFLPDMSLSLREGK